MIIEKIKKNYPIDKKFYLSDEELADLAKIEDNQEIKSMDKKLKIKIRKPEKNIQTKNLEILKSAHRELSNDTNYDYQCIYYLIFRFFLL